MNRKETSLYISRNPEKVIEQIKEKNCILNEIIKPMPDLNPVRLFIEYHYWADSESVNVFQVVGTAHPEYQNIPWIEMLKAGKRMPLNLKLLGENPQYYYENRKKEPAMHYARINDKIYISGEGNHRTSIAKVLFYFTGDTILHGITFEEVKYDINFIKRFRELENFLVIHYAGIKAEVIQKHIKREDTAGWKKDYYRITLKLTNYRKNRSAEFEKDEIEWVLLLLKDLSEGNFLKRLLKKHLAKSFSPSIPDFIHVRLKEVL